MATLPQEFIDLAAELIGDEFAAFAVSTVINKRGNVTYQNPTGSIVATDTIPTIRLEFKETQFNGELIKVGDYMLIGEFQELAFQPSPDNCEAVRAGVTSEIKSVNIDPAGATIILHVRPK